MNDVLLLVGGLVALGFGLYEVAKAFMPELRDPEKDTWEFTFHTPFSNRAVASGQMDTIHYLVAGYISILVGVALLLAYRGTEFSARTVVLAVLSAALVAVAAWLGWRWLGPPSRETDIR